MNQIIYLDVGGTIFKTTKDTLLKTKYFTNMFHFDNPKEEKIRINFVFGSALYIHLEFTINKYDGPIFIDRDPDIFKEILRLLHGSITEFPNKWIQELDFYGIEFEKEKENDKIEDKIYIDPYFDNIRRSLITINNQNYNHVLMEFELVYNSALIGKIIIRNCNLFNLDSISIEYGGDTLLKIPQIYFTFLTNLNENSIEINLIDDYSKIQNYIYFPSSLKIVIKLKQQMNTNINPYIDYEIYQTAKKNSIYNLFYHINDYIYYNNIIANYINIYFHGNIKKILLFTRISLVDFNKLILKTDNHDYMSYYSNGNKDFKIYQVNCSCIAFDFSPITLNCQLYKFITIIWDCDFNNSITDVILLVDNELKISSSGHVLKKYLT